MRDQQAAERIRNNGQYLQSNVELLPAEQKQKDKIESKLLKMGFD